MILKEAEPVEAVVEVASAAIILFDLSAAAVAALHELDVYLSDVQKHRL